MAEAEINIHALAISDTVDHSVVRMVVSDPTRALMLLGESGVLATENDVLMIESDNEPGTLAKIADQLSKVQVNIEYAYLATSPKSNKGLMILRPNDVKKAQAALVSAFLIFSHPVTAAVRRTLSWIRGFLIQFESAKFA